MLLMHMLGRRQSWVLTGASIHGQQNERSMSTVDLALHAPARLTARYSFWRGISPNGLVAIEAEKTIADKGRYVRELGQTRTSSLGAARPLPSGADIGPGG